MTAAESPPSGPYAAAAETYWRSGWRGVLPIPPGQKAPVPNGWTGREGEWPSYADLQAWIEGDVVILNKHRQAAMRWEGAAGNIGLRLPPNVLGVDVDMYGSKPGYLVLRSLEQQLGALPATWRSTSRDDGMSGIRLYRIPEGLRWPGVLGPGIETIRYEHRYAVAWPSLHPNGGTYRWITPEGATALESVPAIDDLPRLPDAWVDHFTHGELATDQARADLTDSAAGQWVAERGTGVACRHMASALASAQGDLTTASSRHDATLQATNRLTWLAGEGHTGGTEALAQLREAFLKATAGDRAAGDAEAEWDRMVSGAVRLAAAAHPTTTTDPCEDPFAGLIPKDTTWPATSPTVAPTGVTPSSASASASPSPSSSGSQAPSTASSSALMTAPTTSHAAASAESLAATAPTSAADADDLTELQLRRNQAAAQEVERLRASRTAQRLLEREDEAETIADRVRRRILDDKAVLEYKRQTEPLAPPFDAGTLADVLARPDDPPMRADGLIPWDASTLLVAARKTGKTTTLLNYARCLLTGEPFLGEFPIIPLEPGQRIALMNYEVSGKMVARWADDLAIDPDRFFLVNLRGRRNPLGREDDRASLAALLRGLNIGALMVDPFGRAYTGESQNDNAEVQRFLVDLDTFARNDVGASDLILAAHAGWDGERTRGASALEDWPDTIINLTGDEAEGKRFMRALGRDVDVDEDELVMDPITRILSRAGTGPRKAGKRNARTEQATADIAVLVTRVVNATGREMGQNEIKKAIADLPKGDAKNVGDGTLGRSIRLAAEGGFLVLHEGVGVRGAHIIHRRDHNCSHCSDCSQTAPGAVPPPLLPTPVGGSSGSSQSGNLDDEGRSSHVAGVGPVNRITGEVS